jgi:predicted dehydrogenase
LAVVAQKRRLGYAHRAKSINFFRCGESLVEHVRIGVVGLGTMGSAHLRYFRSLVGGGAGAVCDANAERAKATGEEFGVPWFTDYRDMIANGPIDAVLIATPHFQHPEVTIAALDKGLHVLCEKPMAVTVGAARTMIAAHEKHPKQKFGLMFNVRTYPMYQKIRSLVQDGDLGAISRVTWIITDWFRTWTYYASGGWRATWAGEGGGVLLNQCPHNLDLLYWLTGMMPNRITAVASIAKTHPIEVEDEVSAILEYPNGAIGHFITSTGEAPGSNYLEIAGDQGVLSARQGKLQFRRTRESVKKIRETSPQMFPNPETWDIDLPYAPQAENTHKLVTQNFIDSILKDVPLAAPGEEGIKGLEIGNAMLMAGLTRTPVELPIDPAKYDQFLADMTKQHGGKKAPATAPQQVGQLGRLAT